MPKISIIIVALASAILRSAAMAYVVDVAALSACGTGTTNGWTVAGIDSYAGKANFRLKSSDDRIDSPVFDQAVRSIVIDVKSSSRSGRRLAFIPLAGDETLDHKSLVCEYSPTDGAYVRQTLEFPRSDDVRAFRIALDDGGGTTGWGVSYMQVVTFGESAAATPSGVAASRVRSDSFVAEWTADANAVSNRVSVYRVVTSGESGETVLRHTFDEFSNKGSTAEKTDDIVALYPDLEGSSCLTLPTNSTGRIQVSMASKRGALRHRAFDDYRSLWLSVTLAKSKEADLDTTSVGFEAEDGTLERICTIPLATEMARAVVPLEEIDGGRPVVLNMDGRQENHRVVIDEMSFIRGYAPAGTTTNLVATVWSSVPGRAKASGLAPDAEYVFTVSAADADGAMSAESEPVSVTTSQGASQGLRVTLR
ncbi:MAG: fibronectin type III domain-containing protein [Kiritimatiellae bacterium]|nr:fibronectin type III domain-containing protein [Kiritimatiellia bacterium]